MPLIPDTPMLRRRLRAATKSGTGVVTFGDVFGAVPRQGRMVPVKDAATGATRMVREELPPIDPIEERRHFLVYLGLNLLGHIEDDPIADIPSSITAGRSVADALHRPSADNDRIFATDMRTLIADLRAADRLLGYKQIVRLEEVISQVLD